MGHMLAILVYLANVFFWVVNMSGFPFCIFLRFRVFRQNTYSSLPSIAWAEVRSPSSWASTPPWRTPRPPHRAQPGSPSSMSPSSLGGVLATSYLRSSSRCIYFLKQCHVFDFQNLGYYGVFGLTLGAQLFLLVFLLCYNLPQSHSISPTQSVIISYEFNLKS